MKMTSGRAEDTDTNGYSDDESNNSVDPCNKSDSLVMESIISNRDYNIDKENTINNSRIMLCG